MNQDLYVFQSDGKHAGPFSNDSLARAIFQGQFSPDAYVAPIGAAQWLHASQLPEIMAAVETLKRASSAPPPPVGPTMLSNAQALALALPTNGFQGSDTALTQPQPISVRAPVAPLSLRAPSAPTIAIAPASPAPPPAPASPAPPAPVVAPMAAPAAPMVTQVAPMVTQVAPMAAQVAPMAPHVAPMAAPVAPLAAPVASMAAPIVPMAAPVVAMHAPVAPIAAPLPPPSSMAPVAPAPVAAPPPPAPMAPTVAAAPAAAPAPAVAKPAEAKAPEAAKQPPPKPWPKWLPFAIFGACAFVSIVEVGIAAVVNREPASPTQSAPAQQHGTPAKK